MRDIRFRGKTTTEGIWIAGSYAHVSGGVYGPDRHLIGVEYKGRFGKMLQVDPETVGQYIGKVDKYGKKIYEGDIVKTKYGRLCIVTWFDSRMYSGWDLKVVNTRENVRNTSASSGYDVWASENLEVVGNIHDNPEMLRD